MTKTTTVALGAEDLNDLLGALATRAGTLANLADNLDQDGADAAHIEALRAQEARIRSLSDRLDRARTRAHGGRAR